MDILSISHVSGLFFLALLLGGMGFFAFIMTPLVFTKLPPSTAGPFIRLSFPIYSKAMGGLSLIAALLIWQRAESVALLTVFVFFILAWLVLMPRINHYRDLQLAGNVKAKKPFNRLHKLSVAINSLQMMTAAVVFIRLVSF
jgi:hypothetical protein